MTLSEHMIQIDSKNFPDSTDAYVVGGTIRDLLCDRPPVDYDIVVLHEPEKFANELAVKTAGHVIEIGKPGLSVLRVITEDLTYDISAAAGTTIEQDLQRRDFTINAMALHLSTGNLIDCMGSRDDLSQKRIRMVSQDVFSKDPVRLIRAYRLAAGLGFTIEPLTAAAIENHAELILSTAGERIREELLKLFKVPKSFDYLSQMVKSSLLNVIIPELNDLSQCIQNKNLPTTVLDHTLQAYLHLETRLDEVERLLNQQHLKDFQQHMESRKALLQFSILLHDIGKPATMGFKKDGEVQFYRHAAKSAELARAVCKRIRFSNLETDYVEFITQNHLYPFHLFAAHQKNRLRPRALSRFYRICHDRTPDLLLHAVADFNGSNREAGNRFCNFAGELINTFYTEFVPRAALPPIITGNDLSSEFNLPPSPLYKQILTRVEDERLSKDSMGRQEALMLVEKFLKKRSLLK